LLHDTVKSVLTFANESGGPGAAVTVSDNSQPSMPLALALLMILGWLAFFLFLYLRRRKKYGGPPKFAGHPISGTGRIMYVTREGRGHPPLDAKIQPIRSIRLIVNIPGHEPYDATATQEIPVPALYRIDPDGGTVAVQVDSADLNYVRVDFSQPIT
jgi:hypothetical protein